MSEPHGQVITQLTEGQTQSGAEEAAKLLNKSNSEAQFDKPKPTVIKAPTPTSVQSLEKSAKDLSSFSDWWNTMCNQFQWEATTPNIETKTGGKNITRRVHKKNNRKKNGKGRHIRIRKTVRVNSKIPKSRKKPDTNQK